MRHSALIAVGLTAAILSTGSSRADEFTAADVLAWDQKSRDWWLQTSLAMLGMVTARNSTERARCINDWYFAAGVDRSKRNDPFIEAMKAFPEHHPGAVLIAAVQKRCGSLNFSE